MSGRLVVVGTGIRSIAQLTMEAAAWIRAADVVCFALADPVTQRWVVDNARASEDLAVYYDEAATRLTTYARMAERMVGHAREGRTVVGAFYGHPGVFTHPSHRAIAMARAEGIPAQMLPGVSAEDCLFADLGLDPGDSATQSFEATELMIRGRVPDTSANVILWQIAVLAQRRFDRAYSTSNLGPLVDYLVRFYPADHVVTHYQGSQYVLCDPLIQKVRLGDLPGVQTALTSTLYVPPLRERDYDVEMATLLGLNEPTPPDGDATGGPVPPTPGWYVPLAGGSSRIHNLVAALSLDPSLLDAFRRDPGIYLGLFGLDAVETWAVTTRNAALVSLCARLGSGPSAAVAAGMAATEEEARTFTVSADGLLMRPRRPGEGGPGLGAAG